MCGVIFFNGGGDAACQRTLLLKIFYAQMIKKVRRSNAPFYRELQNCEKSLIKSKIAKIMQRTFPDKSSQMRFYRFDVMVLSSLASEKNPSFNV